MHNIRITESSLTLFPCTVAPLRWRLHWLHCIRRLPLTAPSSRLLQGNHRMTINHFPATKTEWPHLVLSVSLLLALWALFLNFFFVFFCTVAFLGRVKGRNEASGLYGTISSSSSSASSACDHLIYTSAIVDHCMEEVWVRVSIGMQIR